MNNNFKNRSISVEMVAGGPHNEKYKEFLKFQAQQMVGTL
jgi:hypothetical protein